MTIIDPGKVNLVEKELGTDEYNLCEIAVEDEVFNDARNRILEAMEDNNLIPGESDVVEEARQIINEDPGPMDGEEA